MLRREAGGAGGGDHRDVKRSLASPARVRKPIPSVCMIGKSGACVTAPAPPPAAPALAELNAILNYFIPALYRVPVDVLHLRGSVGGSVYTDKQ